MLNYDIFLNEFPAYFWKYQNLIYDISQNMLENSFKNMSYSNVDIWLEVGLYSVFFQVVVWPLFLLVVVSEVPCCNVSWPTAYYYHAVAFN